MITKKYKNYKINFILNTSFINLWIDNKNNLKNINDKNFAYFMRGYDKGPSCVHVTYSRWIYYDGNIYEGGFNKRSWHGKGEMEYYSDGRIEKGSWVNGDKQGEFEVTYKDGTAQKVMYEKKNMKVKNKKVKNKKHRVNNNFS